MKLSKNIFSFQKSNILLLVIILFGVYIRFIGLNKVDGLWLDEIYSYYHASHTFPFGILHTLYLEDFHPPLYYFILHFWMKLFGSNDIIIRLLSVLFGVLTIPVAYLAGKEFSNKKTGLLTAFLVALNSFLIYYSQEVRFYSMLAFLGTLSVLFILKIKNNPTKWNYFGLILSNILILYTSTIGFTFIFAEAVSYLVYLIYPYLGNLYKKNKIELTISSKKELKALFFSQLITAGLYIPYLPTLLHHFKVASESFIGVFSWVEFDISNVLSLLQNWFSPAISDLYNNNPHYLDILFNAFLNLPASFSYLLITIVPLVIAFIAIVKASISKKTSLILISISLLFIVIEVISTLSGSFGLLSRYTTLAFPPIIIVMSYGLLNFKNKFISRVLIGSFVFINLIFLIFSPISAPKIPRSEGLKSAAVILLNKYHFTSDDMIIMPYGGKFLSKYYPADKNARILDLNILEIKDNPEKDIKYFDKKLQKQLNIKNAHDLLKPYFLSWEPSKAIENYIEKEAINKLKKGRYLVLAYPPVLKNFSDQDLKDIIKKDDLYKRTALFQELASKISSDIVKVNLKHLKLVSDENIGSWNIIVFQK